MTKKSFLATAGAVILLMIIGSFADFQISSALFNTSSVFGNIFAAYGELPLGVFMLVPIYILLFCHEGQKTVGKVFSILGGILMLGAHCIFCYSTRPDTFVNTFGQIPQAFLWRPLVS